MARRETLSPSPLGRFSIGEEVNIIDFPVKINAGQSDFLFTSKDEVVAGLDH
jgi:hypothetical protein